jgi:two-component system sensor histidine kinase KdpD
VLERLKGTVLKEHPVSTSFSPSIPLALVDYLQMDQVLTNLLENAAKYSAPTSPITIQVEVHDPANINGPDGDTLDKTIHTPRVLLLKVLDEGRGIPTAELELIFDKFYRVRSDINILGADTTGTGMGLAITRGIVEAHGGKVWAQNRLYGGAIFTVALPVEPQIEEEL